MKFALFCLLIAIASASAAPFFCNKDLDVFQERNQQKIDGLGKWVHYLDIYSLSQDGKFTFAQSSLYYQVDLYEQEECRFREIQFYPLAPGAIAIQEINIAVLSPGENSLRDPQRYGVTFTTPPAPGAQDLSNDDAISIQMNKRTVGISFINNEGDVTLQESIVNTVPGVLREYTIGSFQRIPIDEQGNTINKQVADIKFNCQNLPNFPSEVEDALTAWEAGTVQLDPNYGSFIYYYQS